MTAANDIYTNTFSIQGANIRWHRAIKDFGIRVNPKSWRDHKYFVMVKAPNGERLAYDLGIAGSTKLWEARADALEILARDALGCMTYERRIRFNTHSSVLPKDHFIWKETHEFRAALSIKTEFPK